MYKLKPGTKLKIILGKDAREWHLNPKLCNNKIAYFSHLAYSSGATYIWVTSTEKVTKTSTDDCFTTREIQLVKD
jgi:hypothetical protein